MLNEFTIRACPLNETILLRDNKKKLIDYKDSAETIQWRESLERINHCLEGATIGLHVKEDELADINEQLNRVPKKQPIDFTRKRLRRIFNNGMWDEGVGFTMDGGKRSRARTGSMW